MLRAGLVLSPPDSQTFISVAGLGDIRMLFASELVVSPSLIKEYVLRKFRVVVADDNPAFLQKLTSVLEAEFDIVGRAGDGKSALDVIRRVTPDFVVLDLAMPILNGIEVLKELAKSPHRPPVVICSVERDPEIVEAAINAGASAYVLKVRIESDLMLAVKGALKGKPFVSPMAQNP